MSKQIPVACCHTVFTKEQRASYKSIWEKLRAKMLDVTELEQGYEYRFPGDAETLRLVNEWVGMERKCCPFLTFAVIAGNEECPVSLQLTGNEEAKTFLRGDLQANMSKIVEG